MSNENPLEGDWLGGNESWQQEMVLICYSIQYNNFVFIEKKKKKKKINWKIKDLILIFIDYFLLENRKDSLLWRI